MQSGLACSSALVIDPQSAEAQTRLAYSLVGRVLEIMTGSAAADMERAEGLVGQALAASPSSSFAHIAKGQLLRAQGRSWSKALVRYGAGARKRAGEAHPIHRRDNWSGGPCLKMRERGR